MEMPIVTLTNGLRVGNFSSPHVFNFTDGSELGACHPDRVKTSMLDSIERETVQTIRGIDVHNVELEFALSDSVKKLIQDVFWTWRKEDHVDIVLVPFPVLKAMTDASCEYRVGIRYPDDSVLGFNPKAADEHPFRVIRSADRQTKAIHIDRFCL